MTDRRPPRSAGNTPNDLNIGGLIKTLGELVERLSQLADIEGVAAPQPPEGGRNTYGSTDRGGGGRHPHVERFGNIRTSNTGREGADIREPLVDCFDEGDELVIVAELPGAREQEVQIDAQGDVLALEMPGERRFAREILLPNRVDAASVRQTCRNGILEIRLKKA